MFIHPFDDHDFSSGKRLGPEPPVGLSLQRLRVRNSGERLPPLPQVLADEGRHEKTWRRRPASLPRGPAPSRSPNPAS
jgi:hypothetical protein